MVTVKEDAEKILSDLARTVPTRIEGKSAIEEMFASGSNHWRQMEWIGFWFEYFVETELTNGLDASRGPRYGMTEFDLKRNFVWDLKAHPMDKPSLILNDQEAVRKCISENGGLGFIILEGETEMDLDGNFKRWHDAFKGKTSNYEVQRVAEGRPSRMRKVAFVPKFALAVFIENESELERATSTGWLKSFQEGMRNSDGRPRRAKYMITSTAKIPESYVVARINIGKL